VANLKRACPTAYSYPCADPTSTFQCHGTGASNMLGYKVVFMNMPRPPMP
jgi:hypothetical protein